MDKDKADKTKTDSLLFFKMLGEVLSGQRECLHAPDSPVKPGEVVLGILEDSRARAAYSMKIELANSLNKFLENLQGKDEALKDKEYLRRMECLVRQHANRCKCADMFFWEMVYSLFPQTRGGGDVVTGIREGWKVVILKSPPLLIFGLAG